MTDETTIDVEPTLDELDTDEGKDTLEKTEQESVVPETTEPEKAEKSKELQSALAQKDHWRKKYEQAVKASSKSSEPDGEWKSKVEFLIKHRDYSEEEFDHISTVASRKGVSLEDAAKLESEYIAFKRQKVASENKTPSPSAASFGSFDKQIDSSTPKEEVDRILKERFEKFQKMQDSDY